MSEPEQDAGGLVAAKEQFLEAEKRLRELAQGAVELTRASVMLKKARMGLSDGAEALRDLSERLSEYIGSLAEVTEKLSEAGAAPKHDEETLSRLDAIQKQLTELGSDVGKAASSSSDSRAEQIHALSSSTDELGTISDLLTAHLGTLERLAEDLSSPRSQGENEGVQKVLGQLDGFERKLDGLTSADRQMRLSPDIEGSLNAIPQMGASLSHVVSSLQSADLQGGPVRLAALEESINSLRAQIDQAPVPELPTLDTSGLLDGLEQRLSEVSSHVRTLDLHSVFGKLETLDERFATLQGEVERAVRRASAKPGPAGSSGQLELMPDVEDGLIALAQEVHAREMTMVDMFAELRRSLGQELNRNQEEIANLVGGDREALKADIAGLRRLLWVVALAATGGLLLGFFQLF